MSSFRGRVWTPSGLLDDAVVDVEERVIRSVRSPRLGDPEPLAGLLVPGLVNAHTHVELGWAADRVPGGAGVMSWVGGLLRLAVPDASERVEAIRRDCAELARAGTAVVSDITNRGDTAPYLGEAGLHGTVQHEHLSMDAGTVTSLLEGIATESVRRGELVVRPAPHAPHTTAPELLQRCVEAAGPTASIHCAEGLSEVLFLREGTGAVADLLDALGRDWSWWEAPGLAPAEYLDALGVLGPGLMLVHGVHLTEAELQVVAIRGSSICLCPRSNLHIGGRLPDLHALVAAGVRLALGTDSRASCPDLDVLGEVATLCARAPDLDPALWLTAATHGGAAALGSDLGAIRVGRSPGLLLLHGVGEPGDLARAEPVERSWLVRPASAEG